jgi:hypothetical protein
MTGTRRYSRTNYTVIGAALAQMAESIDRRTPDEKRAADLDGIRDCRDHAARKRREAQGYAEGSSLRRICLQAAEEAERKADAWEKQLTPA